MYKPLYITLDTMKYLNNLVYTVNTNDLNSVKFFIAITQDRNPLNLTGAIVRIVYKKPDNNIFSQDCTITDAINGLCEVVIDSQAYNVEGIHWAEIMVYFDANLVLITNEFKYISKKGILNNDVLYSPNQNQCIAKTITDLKFLINDMHVNGTGVDVKARKKLDDLAINFGEIESRLGVKDNTKKMVLVASGSEFSHTGNITKTFTDKHHGFSIINEGTSSLSFTINDLTFTVKGGESFKEGFAPFTEVSITSTGAYRAYPMQYFQIDTGDENVPISFPPVPNSSTFTGTQTNTLSGNEKSDIFTKDGTPPMTSSSKYTNQEEYSDGNIDITTGISTNSLVLNYDFTKKKGTKSNSILDTVNNVSATLVNVGHDGINDGYTQDKGLLLKPTGYISIPTNNSPLKEYLDLSNGLTLQIASYNTNGVLFRTDPIEWRLFVSSLIQLDYKYLATDLTTKSHYVQGTQFTNMEDYTKYNFSNAINKRDSNAIDVVTVKISPLGSITFYINGAKSTTIIAPPVFTKFINSLINKPLYIRRDIVALNTNSMILAGFSIYNRMLTDSEILSNYQAYEKNTAIERVYVLPEVINLEIGDSQTLLVTASPNQYTSQLITTYESGNTGIVTVNAEGLIRGVNMGQTNIKLSTYYNEILFVNYVNVTVGEQVLTPPPASTRVIDGISINRSLETLMVGENYVAMATAISSELPFDVLNDNIVLWESSNPNVCTANYGVLEGISIGTAMITAYDSTKKYSKSFTVTVIESEKKIILPTETYIVNPAEYSLSLNNTNSSNTTIGIQKALNYASSNAYKKIVFPFGTYLVNPTVRTIEIPTEMFVDFSGSRINIEPSVLTSIGYVMFLFNGVSNSKLYDAHIFGEADSTTTSASVENCISVKFKGGYNSGLESCTVSKSPGFNIITQNNLIKSGTTSRNITKANFEPGNITSNGAIDNTIKLNRWRSINYLDLTGLGEYFMIGYNQGYYGYNYLRSRLYSIHFYNSRKEYITSQMYNLQFYNYVKPASAKYAKLVIYQKDSPTSQDNDFSAIAFIRTVDMPKKCFIIDCTI
ncbi:BppU family phage baseplate upper protein, partial [Peribacillus simplex]|uniref:BppU family phage baseplate upper protein n=1 Tax=Peribacillus simplex TaxID=1478 RepID=UPI002E2060F8|nr:BppU family phage baseplate upper protein [Peribacillus simplex]